MAAWEHAFTEVVAHRGDALLRYAYLLCGDTAEASDLVQDALLRTFARARLGTDLHRIEAYLRRAVLNAYLDDRRKRQRFASIRHLLTALTSRTRSLSPSPRMKTSVARSRGSRHASVRAWCCGSTRTCQWQTSPSSSAAARAR